MILNNQNKTEGAYKATLRNEEEEEEKANDVLTLGLKNQKKKRVSIGP